MSAEEYCANHHMSIRDRQIALAPDQTNKLSIYQQLNKPHDSINDLLRLLLCFCFCGCSIFQFLLEGFLGLLAGVSLTGQFAGSLETVVSTGFGSLKVQIKFKISSQRAQKMFKTSSSPSQVQIKFKRCFKKVQKMFKNFKYFEKSTEIIAHLPLII